MHLDRELLRMVNFQDQRNEITMIHGPEIDVFGDDVFLAYQSCNLSHLIRSEKIGNMASLGQKSSD